MRGLAGHRSWRCTNVMVTTRQATPMSTVPGAMLQIFPHYCRSRTQANFQHETSATEPFLAAILDFRTIYCLRHTFTSLQSSPTLILRTDQATASKHHHQVHDFQTQIKVLRDVVRHSNRLIPTFNSALSFPLSASHSASRRHRYRHFAPHQATRPHSLSHVNLTLYHWACKTLLLASRRCANETAWPR